MNKNFTKLKFFVDCKNIECPGPVIYYKELKCKPNFKNPGDCCASSYDCSHLEVRNKNQCYVNDNVYNLGDNLNKEDEGRCDIGCHCRADEFGV